MEFSPLELPEREWCGGACAHVWGSACGVQVHVRVGVCWYQGTALLFAEILTLRSSYKPAWLSQPTVCSDPFPGRQDEQERTP